MARGSRRGKGEERQGGGAQRPAAGERSGVWLARCVAIRWRGGGGDGRGEEARRGAGELQLSLPTWQGGVGGKGEVKGRHDEHRKERPGSKGAEDPGPGA